MFLLCYEMVNGYSVRYSLQENSAVVYFVSAQESFYNNHNFTCIWQYMLLSAVWIFFTAQMMILIQYQYRVSPQRGNDSEWMCHCLSIICTHDSISFSVCLCLSVLSGTDLLNRTQGNCADSFIRLCLIRLWQ